MRRILTGIAVLAVACTAAAVAGGRAAPGPDRAAPSPVAPLDYSADPQSPIARLRREFVEAETGLGTAGRMPRSDTTLAPRVGRVAPDFRCVNGRQTADPLSPPCDTSAAPGDNGGATYAGVTEEEIRIVVLALHDQDLPTRDPNVIVRSPRETIVDLAKPPASEPEFLVSSALRDFQQYFNERFQTYGRFLHFYVHYDSPWGDDEQTNAALTEFDAIDPFASFMLDYSSGSVAYPRAYAARGRVGVAAMRDPFVSQEYYANQAGRLFGLWPTRERYADLMASYVCQKMVGKPASLAGLGLRDKPRRFAVLTTRLPGRSTWDALALEVYDRLKACGADVAELAWFDTACAPSDLNYAGVQAGEIWTRFMLKGVTTIVWPACPTDYFGAWSLYTGYKPEWVVGADGMFDRKSWVNAADFGDVFDGHAVLISPRTYAPPQAERPCARALREIDPETTDAELFWECGMYDQLHQLVTAIQLAGPDLTPESLARGMQSLPQLVSPDPLLPACWYLPDDGSCWKDATVMRWDRNGVAKPYYGGPRERGCWRAVEGGRRYLPGTWPPGNVEAQFSPADPCDHLDSAVPGSSLQFGGFIR